MRAAAYTRVSTPGQAEEGHSLEAQIHDIRVFAELKGWQLAATYVDEGLSGSLADRPSLMRLLHDAEAGLFEVVIVHKVDRFFRDLAGFLGALKRLNEANVSFISVRESIDFTSPWGKLALVILATIAEIFLDMLREETMKGKRQRVREGLWNGSIPTGYCLGLCAHCADPNGPGYCPRVGCETVGDGHNLVLHPIDSVAVRMMFEWYVTGDYSDADIARAINTYNHHLPDGTLIHPRTRGRGHGSNHPPGPYGKDTIRSLLRNEVFTGLVTYKGETTPGNHPIIVDPELFAKAQHVRKLRGNTPHSDRETARAKARVFPLTGILRCAGCGGGLRGQGSPQGVRYYRCVNRMQRKRPCRQRMVRADVIEEEIAALICSVQIPLLLREDVFLTVFPQLQLADVERDEAELHARYDRAVELFLSGKIDRTRLDKEELAYRRDLARLTGGQAGAILKAVRLIDSFSTLWEAAAAKPLEQRAILQTILSAVHTRDKQIEGVEPQAGFYALFEYCSYGSDGRRPLSK